VESERDTTKTNTPQLTANSQQPTTSNNNEQQQPKANQQSRPKSKHPHSLFYSTKFINHHAA